MKKVKMLGLLVVMLLLAGIFPVKTYAAGWIQGDNGLWWYQHGKPSEEKIITLMRQAG